MKEQLTFWEETSEEKLERRMTALEDRLLKTMRSQYAKIGELTKKCSDQEHELEILKSAMARCGLKISLKSNTSLYIVEKDIL